MKLMNIGQAFLAASVASVSSGQCVPDLAPVALVDLDAQIATHAYFDSDLDGDIELVVTTGFQTDGTTRVYELVDGVYSLAFERPGGGRIRLEDINGDGNDDLVLGRAAPGTRIRDLQILTAPIGASDPGIFLDVTSLNTRGPVQFVDFDVDGDLDAVSLYFVGGGPQAIKAFRFKGRSFEEISTANLPSPTQPLQSWSNVAFGEFVDGEIGGIVAAGSAASGGNVAYLRIDSSGELSYFEEWPAQVRVATDDRGQMALDVVNGDGQLEVMWACTCNDGFRPFGFYELVGVDPVIFTSMQIDGPFSGAAATPLEAADFDGDGFRDIRISTQYGSNLPISQIYFADGAGDYVMQLDHPVPYESVWFDVDGDGDLDLTWPSDSGLAFRENLCIGGPPKVLPDGACCLPQGGCVVTSYQDCFAVGGSWAGPNTTCEDVICPDRCVGDINFDGAVDFIDLVALLAAWGNCL